MGTQTEKQRQGRGTHGRTHHAPARRQGSREGGAPCCSRLAWRTSSFGRLHRSAENLRQQMLPRNAGNRLDVDGPPSIKPTALPARNRRLVDRRIEQQTERLKRQLVRLTIQSNGVAVVFHADSSCILCNI